MSLPRNADLGSIAPEKHLYTTTWKALDAIPENMADWVSR